MVQRRRKYTFLIFKLIKDAAGSNMCQNVCVDQSVPLTPDGHRGSNSIIAAVFHTPNRTASLSASTPTQLLFEQHSPISQGISLKSATQSADQCVPSTPKDLHKNKLKCLSFTQQLLSSSPISPVLNASAAKIDQTSFEVISPVQISQHVASTSYADLVSPTAEDTVKILGESGYFLTSPDGRKGSNFGAELAPSSTGSSRKKSTLCSTDQCKLDPRKFPPSSRRRLSLGQKGPKDALRRAAHHNVAFQRSLNGDKQEAKNVCCSSITFQDSPAVDPSDEIFPSADVHISSEPGYDSGFSETLTKSGVLWETSGDNLPLMTSAGDASDFLVDHNPKLCLENRMNSAEKLGIDRLPTPFTQKCSGADEYKASCEKKHPTPLDLFNDDKIFD
ncbi:hypothetical protein RRG08_051076 [Elysia crispata]|uniref:Uncharacterized protein n=1 Tax=Elysia crispata TaxID=231223 RepID=A0AAE1ADB5_9GAST|nr:hypothetical protein RRG08_051076 [Elysia crispata]